MELGELISLYRKQKGMTIDELAEKSGVPKGTINKIIGGITKAPTLENIRAIAYALDKTLNDFDNSPSIKKSPSDLSEEAKKIAKDYDRLTDHGKGAVRLIMEYEGKAEITATPKQPVGHPKVIPLPKVKRSHGFTEVEVFDEPAAAGLGNPIETPPSHMEQYPSDYVPTKTNFGVLISGDSMEPKIPNGSTVFLQATPVLDNGEIGIFVLDGKSYCKQLKKDEESQEVKLHSLNPEYKDIEIPPFTELKVLGRVLGGYDPHTRDIIW
jgi:phage repressor protein C with HTH and peptisase S24 domain